MRFFYFFILLIFAFSCVIKGSKAPLIKIGKRGQEKVGFGPKIPVNTNSTVLIADPKKLSHNENGFVSRSKVEVVYKKIGGLGSYRFINKVKSPSRFVYTLSRPLALEAGKSYNQTIYLKGFESSIGKKVIFGNYRAGRRVESVITLTKNWQKVSISFIARERHNNTYLYLRRRGRANLTFNEGIDVLYLGVIENIK